jgi:hypothetical protein
VRGGGQRRSDEAVSLGEAEEFFHSFGVGQRVELDVEPAMDLHERITAVVVALGHEPVCGGRALHVDAPPLGVEVEAGEGATRETREDEVLGRPVRLRARRLTEALGDRELETLGRYVGQRVITTFFSV